MADEEIEDLQNDLYHVFAQDLQNDLYQVFALIVLTSRKGEIRFKK